jgi:hypothetical protein
MFEPEAAGWRRINPECVNCKPLNDTKPKYVNYDLLDEGHVLTHRKDLRIAIWMVAKPPCFLLNQGCVLIDPIQTLQCRMPPMHLVWPTMMVSPGTSADIGSLREYTWWTGSKVKSWQRSRLCRIIPQCSMAAAYSLSE